MDNEYLKRIYGLLESGATLGTGAVSGLVGLPYGLYKGVTSGAYGTPEAPRIAAREAQQFMERNTYQPRTAEGQENLRQLAGLLEASKLPPVMPEASLLAAIPKQAYAAQAERAGMAAEKAIEPVVTRTMERGGLPAQLLGDLAQGSRRQIFVPASQEEAFQAAKLLRKKTPEEVWQETGVAKFGNDFVKEISDKEAKAEFTHLYDVNNGNQLRERAYEHPELYSLVPELKDIKQLGLRENLLSGSYRKIGEGKMMTAKAPTEEDLKTVLTHEMQHGVQDVYGWERGGSIKDIAHDIAANKYQAEEVMSKLERMQNVASDNARHANKELIDRAKQWADESDYWNKNADNQEIVKNYLLSTDPVYASLYQTHADLAYNKPALLGAEETYNRLAGEVQARSAQNRVNLTPEERRMYFPFELKSEANPYGLDVAPEDLLYRSKMGENQLRRNQTAAMEGLLGQSKAAESAPITSLKDIENKFNDVTLDVYEKNGTINLSRIVVPKDMRSSGVGSNVMNDLTSYADQTGQKMALTPSGEFGGNVKRLKDFYKQFGFVENKGKNKDFSTMETMIRLPETRKEPKELTNLLD